MNSLARCSVTLLSLFGLLAVQAENVDFHICPRLAGKALLTETGFVVKRELGVANLAPEMRMPVELVYKSMSEKSGAFGFAWRCPQLESAVKWSKDSLLWTTPWGEELRFYPKKAKTPKDAITLEPIEAAKKGRGLFSPYADWETDADSSDYAKCRRFAILGKNDLKGWRLEYLDGGLASVTTPYGVTAEFVRDAQGQLVAVASQGVRFVELARNADGLVSELRLNGVPTAFAYAQENRTIPPKTADGLPKTVRVAALKSVKTASLDAETFDYEGGYLASAKRGKWSETFKVSNGRLLADGDYSYSGSHSKIL
jgi:YD repeat-containing protein